MSYREILKKQIEELEQKISSTKEDKKELELLLRNLQLSEFEEDMKESQEQKLLKG